jgi:hypothetical protein
MRKQRDEIIIRLKSNRMMIRRFPSRFWDDKRSRLRYRAAMITIAASNFWYFSYDSSLAVGGSRSI